MPNRSPEEFKEAAKKLHKDGWTIHRCSFCEYPCGFRFRNSGNVIYDNGCHCSPREPRESGWDEVAQQYNIQSSPESIKQYDEFWGFDKPRTDG